MNYFSNQLKNLRNLFQEYGKVPSYLVRIKRNFKQSRLEFERSMTAEDRAAEPQRLSLETKQAILEV